ncbi:hypothetical protein K491DRAFT_714862 [Lophiostoma macrostomum CBS 122681]|uniref:F-box domain-containing protein n=1 Tax=Lophiostoma macrostomum CBS 122681 TaxID=1314788 RepID=A0A6A6TEA2_9PLEO|nr:hypothetical protein K491DRAFT_714862 [Lophiostoma macrostomum CBS 122681]
MKRKLMRVLRIKLTATADKLKTTPAAKARRPPTPKPLEIVELLEQILLHLPQRDLLLAQRVCRRWHAVINSSKHIQQALYLLPLPTVITASQPASNPLLASAFAGYFKLLAWEEFSGTYTSTWASMLLHSTEKRWQQRFIREEANWRRMLVTQPPVPHVDIVDQRIAPDYEDCFAEASVHNEEGVRMGELLQLEEKKYTHGL